MRSIKSVAFLRRVLVVDAVSSAALGLAMLTFTSFTANLLDLPIDLLTEAGLVLLPFAAFVGYVASREQPPRPAVWVIIAINALWVVDSVLLLMMVGSNRMRSATSSSSPRRSSWACSGSWSTSGCVG